MSLITKDCPECPYCFVSQPEAKIFMENKIAVEYQCDDCSKIFQMEVEVKTIYKTYIDGEGPLEWMPSE